VRFHPFGWLSERAFCSYKKSNKNELLEQANKLNSKVLGVRDSQWILTLGSNFYWTGYSELDATDCESRKQGIWDLFWVSRRSSFVVFSALGAAWKRRLFFKRPAKVSPIEKSNPRSCPPKTHSFNTDICRSSFDIFRCWFEQMQCARNPQIAQLFGMFLRTYDFRRASAARQIKKKKTFVHPRTLFDLLLTRSLVNNSTKGNLLSNLKKGSF